MSQQITNAFIKQWESDVFVAFQRQGTKMLAGCRLKDQLKGQSVYFQKVGKGTAASKTRHGLVPVMNQDHSTVECAVADFYAGDYVDKLDELKINIDERQVIASGGAYALGRKVDDQIITAALASLPGGQQIAVGGTGLTKSKIFTAFELLNTNDVPVDDNRFCFVAPHQWSELLNLNEFKSADFVGPDYPFLSGYQARRWMGIIWVMHTGLPKTGDNRTCLMWHKTCMGYARGMDITLDVTWQGERAAWFVDNMMSGGAVRIEDTGVVSIVCDETSVIS